jgi:hypothetical protein
MVVSQEKSLLKIRHTNYACPSLAALITTVHTSPDHEIRTSVISAVQILFTSL